MDKLSLSSNLFLSTTISVSSTLNLKKLLLAITYEVKKVNKFQIL
jgi:hypothetical protein